MGNGDHQCRAGLLLATVGLYGVMAYSVERRTREIGLRVAVGAGQGAILRMVLFDSLKLTAIGSVLECGGRRNSMPYQNSWRRRFGLATLRAAGPAATARWCTGESGVALRPDKASASRCRRQMKSRFRARNTYKVQPSLCRISKSRIHTYRRTPSQLFIGAAGA